MFGTRDCCLPRLRRERVPMSASRTIGRDPCKAHQSLVNSSSGNRLDCRLLSRHSNFAVHGHSAKLLYHSLSLPHLTAAMTPPAASLCALSERPPSKNLAHSHHLSISRDRNKLPYPSNLDSNSRTATPPSAQRQSMRLTEHEQKDPPLHSPAPNPSSLN